MTIRRFPGLDDDREEKREKRSRRRTTRKVDDLDALDVPARSCLTCRYWTQVDATWGECQVTLASRERFGSVETGTVVARWPAPHGSAVTCVDRLWDAVKAWGKPGHLRTHRTYTGCDRHHAVPDNVTPFPRRGPSLRDRVRGNAS